MRLEVIGWPALCFPRKCYCRSFLLILVGICLSINVENSLMEFLTNLLFVWYLSIEQLLAVTARNIIGNSQ
jgi:hypothetical protein